jgi:hypothetical protein
MRREKVEFPFLFSQAVEPQKHNLLSERLRKPLCAPTALQAFACLVLFS